MTTRDQLPSKLNPERKRKLRERFKQAGKRIPITLYTEEEVKAGLAEAEGAISFRGDSKELLAEEGRPIPEQDQKEMLEAMKESKKYEPRKLSEEKDVLWRVHGVLVDRGTTCFAALSEAGKTTLAIQLSSCLINGNDFLGIPIIKPIEKVLWVEHDQDASMLKDQAQRMDVALPDKLYTRDDISWNPDDRTFSNLAKVCYWWRPQLVVIDSLGSIGLRDENDNSEISALYTYLRILMNKYGFSTILIHHLTKGGETKDGRKIPLKQRIRGAGDIVNKADCVLGLERSGNQVTLTNVKLRAEDRLQMTLLQDPHTLRFSRETPRDEAIRQLVEQEKPRQETIQVIHFDYGGSKGTVEKAVDRERKRFKDRQTKDT